MCYLYGNLSEKLYRVTSVIPT